MNYLHHSDVERIYQITQEAAIGSRNVGLDEFPDVEAFKDNFLQSEGFTIKDERQNTIEGAILVQPNVLSRSTSPTVAHIHVFLSECLYQAGVFREMLAMGVVLARDLRLRYSTCVTWAFQVSINI